MTLLNKGTSVAQNRVRRDYSKYISTHTNTHTHRHTHAHTHTPTHTHARTHARTHTHTHTHTHTMAPPHTSILIMHYTQSTANLNRQQTAIYRGGRCLAAENTAGLLVRKKTNVSGLQSPETVSSFGEEKKGHSIRVEGQYTETALELTGESLARLRNLIWRLRVSEHRAASVLPAV